jgi:thioredoxin-related protein
MKVKIISIIICFILAFATTLAIRKVYFYYLDFQAENTPQYQKVLDNKELKWIGPEIGEKIDLNELKDKNESSLSEKRKNKKAFIVYIHPDCGMCKLARKEIADIISKVKENSFDVAIVSFNTLINPEKLETYNELIGSQVNVYSWKNYDTQIPKLVEMGTPSFIIVDSQGIILQKFPGLHSDAHIRRAMVKEIMNSIIAEKTE